jgi:hypothetical protein
MTDGQDWRLEAESDAGGSLLDRALQAVHGRADELGSAEVDVPHGVAVTHDGGKVFAYADSQAAISATRDALASQLTREGNGLSNVRISRWDPSLNDWVQVDPPLAGAAAAQQDAAVRDAATPETQTVICTAGKGIDEQVEETMREAAEALGLKVEIVEHPHLLTTQVAFELTGPRGSIAEFRRELRAEGLATIRAEANLFNPL